MQLLCTLPMCRKAGQMKKFRKILCSLDAPYIGDMMKLAETQSKETLGKWAISYAESHFLPIYEGAFADDRPKIALASAKKWFRKEMKLPEVKTQIFACHAAAKEAEGNPAAQAAARAIAHASAIAHTASHSLGAVVYGSTALAYHQLGIQETLEAYEEAIAQYCQNMTAALQKIAVTDEANPSKINWAPMTSEKSLLRRG